IERVDGGSGSFSASRVSIAGLNRLVFHDARWDGGAAFGFEATARRLEIGMHAADIIPWLEPEGGRRVVVVDATVRAVTSQAGDHGSDGTVPEGPLAQLQRLLWSGPLHVRRATVRGAEDQVDVEEAEFTAAWG